MYKIRTQPRGSSSKYCISQWLSILCVEEVHLSAIFHGDYCHGDYLHEPSKTPTLITPSWLPPSQKCNFSVIIIPEWFLASIVVAIFLLPRRVQHRCAISRHSGAFKTHWFQIVFLPPPCPLPTTRTPLQTHTHTHIHPLHD